MTTAVLDRARGARFPLGRRVLALGAILAAIVAISIQPGAGNPFAPLAVLTAQLTAGMLAATGLAVTREAATLVHAGGFACEVDLACTALVPAALLVAFMAAWRARPAGLLLGVLVIAFANQVRLVGLVWLGVQLPGYFDPVHQFLGPLFLLAAGIGYALLWRRVTNR